MNEQQRALGQQALKAMRLHDKQYPHMRTVYTIDAIAALNQLLEQPEPVQEPVADGLIRQYIKALVVNKPEDAANATKAMVDYVYTAAPTQGE
jgi:hypothetical protein